MWSTFSARFLDAWSVICVQQLRITGWSVTAICYTVTWLLGYVNFDNSYFYFHFWSKVTDSKKLYKFNLCINIPGNEGKTIAIAFTLHSTPSLVQESNWPKCFLSEWFNIPQGPFQETRNHGSSWWVYKYCLANKYWALFQKGLRL